MSEFNSKKRQASDQKTKDSQENNEPEEERLEFEDPFEDEFEPEEFEGDEDDEEGMGEGEVDNDDEDGTKVNKQTWRPGIDKLPEGEQLEYDPSAYVMYHSLKTEWPCLSFDVVRDNLGDDRQRFPLSLYLVIGSQADRADRNKISLLKMSNLCKVEPEEDSEDEEDGGEDSEDENDDEPVLEHINVNHIGGVNRIRNMPQTAGVVATMADTGKVNIFDLTACTHNMMNKATGSAQNIPTGPVFSFSGHRQEGYALDWSRVVPGRLATGDCAGKIHIWNCETGSAIANLSTTSGYTTPKISCQVDANAPYSGHRSSVEDLQWSPTEATVFCSASSDKSVRVWDIRGKSGPQISVEDAHFEDVNVLSWNTNVSYLVASGSDDGSFKVWDLRSIRNSMPLAHFQYHKGPITSIQWSYHDESLLSVSSSDDQLTIWDLSVEADDEQKPTKAGASITGEREGDEFNEYPPQLLFIHQGQHNVKELHFHPQVPNVILSTAEDGFNMFKPAISVTSN
jgi:ribosome assembly protein RRB1